MLIPIIPDKIFPETSGNKVPKIFSIIFPSPAKTEIMKMEEKRSSIIKKDCLKISNLYMLL